VFDDAHCSDWRQHADTKTPSVWQIKYTRSPIETDSPSVI